jgi:hypothetical protein
LAGFRSRCSRPSSWMKATALSTSTLRACRAHEANLECMSSTWGNAVYRCRLGDADRQAPAKQNRSLPGLPQIRKLRPVNQRCQKVCHRAPRRALAWHCENWLHSDALNNKNDSWNFSSKLGPEKTRTIAKFMSTIRPWLPWPHTRSARRHGMYKFFGRFPAVSVKLCGCFSGNICLQK